MKLTTKINDLTVIFDTETYFITDEAGDILKETKSAEMVEKFITSYYAPKKNKKAFAPIPFFKIDGYGETNLRRGKITSVAEDSRYGDGQQVWVSYENGRREKTSRSYLYADTPENMAVIDRMQNEKAIIETHREKVKQIEKELTRVPEIKEEETTTL